MSQANLCRLVCYDSDFILIRYAAIINKKNLEHGNDPEMIPVKRLFPCPSTPPPDLIRYVVVINIFLNT